MTWPPNPAWDDPWFVLPAIAQYLADRRAARAAIPISDTPPF